MSANPDPLAAILAEMRREAGSQTNPSPLYRYADRIEAAAKREYEEAENYFAKLHDGPSMICTAKNCAVRNVGLSLAAATRKFDEAAFDAAVSKPNGWSDVADPVAEIRRMRDGTAPGNAAAMREALERALKWWTEKGNILEREAAFKQIRAALAAPARNCDRFATAEDAYAAWQKHNSLTAICDWLFAPAEGGDHA